MLETSTIPDAVLEVTSAEGSARPVPVTASPFRIGRIHATPRNHCEFDDRRVSRNSALLTYSDGAFRLEDIGQRSGVFLNGVKVEAPQSLRDGDVITLGQADTLKLTFRSGIGPDALPELLDRMDQTTTLETGDRGLRHLSLLLEATTLLQSQLPLEEVLAAMVDRAIVITQADRGLLLEGSAAAELKPLAARKSGRVNLPLENVKPSQTAIKKAIKQHHGEITRDIEQAEDALRQAHSIVAQKLRSIAAIPLYAHARLQTAETTALTTGGELLGVLYLDSRKPAAFSKIERQILDALALEAASVMENARLVERERDRRRMEHELSIARNIQQSMLPKEFKNAAHLKITGINHSCYAVGGDYFDLMDMGPDRTAFIIADVSGKGLPAALVTATLQGSFAGMTLGQDPISLFNHINRFISTRAAPDRYATLFFGMLDAGGHLEFVNAGHHSPLLIRGTRVEQPFPSECLPIGLLPEAEFKTTTATLEPGDTLVLFTDGINEAENMKQEEFGMNRLCQVAQAHADKPVAELQKGIMTAVREFTGGAEQNDDITLFILRYNGPPA